ncbi:hypothetical protein KCP74_00405 [Salmonella enterica subsp. enterica]|nr:hypothetical protein KCP74_00405 [Salmonella enterica subsp. enterica]
MLLHALTPNRKISLKPERRDHRRAVERDAQRFTTAAIFLRSDLPAAPDGAVTRPHYSQQSALLSVQPALTAAFHQ